MDQGRQGRHQVDAAVMLLVRRQRRASSASCAGLQSRQLHADTGPAGGNQALVVDRPAGKTRQTWCQGRAPRPLRHLPDGRGRHLTANVPGDYAADRRTATAATTSASVRRPMVMRSRARREECVPMPGKMARSAPSTIVRASRGAGNRRHLASVLRQGRKTRILTPVWESSGESRFRGLFGESWIGRRLSARSSDEMYGGWGVFAKLVIRTLIIAPILFTHRVFAADVNFPLLDEGRVG